MYRVLFNNPLVVATATPSFLEVDWGYVVIGVLLLVAQLAVVVGLLDQRARLRHAEEESRKSNERYRSIVDAQSELVCRYLPDTTLTFVNDAYCRFWNQDRKELLGRKFIELIPPLARKELLERIRALSSGSYTHEHPVTRPDGTIGWHHWVNQAILDGQGHLIELQGVGRDISDRIRAEQAHAQVEARNLAILRALPDLMLVLRRDGTYLHYHARDKNHLFAPPEQFLGRKIRDVLPPGLGDTLMEALDRACQSDDPVVVEYELTIDEPRHFEARLVSAEEDRVLCVVRDVTDAKCAQARIRALAGRLIASQEVERSRIARDLHDGVCQDVASVAVDLSYLRQSRGELQGFVVQERLLALQRRTTSLAEQLRLLSHGLHSSVLHHIGLVAALKSHCAEVERQHQLQVTFFADGDVEPASEPVALSLFRIAQEALRNSVRHGHARHASVSLRRSASDLKLTIEDDGGGFDLHRTTRNDGLGLASMEERAHLVGGKTVIRSRPGAGTTVDVRVPLEIVADRTFDVESGHEPRLLRPLPRRTSVSATTKEDGPSNRLAG